MPRQTRPIGQTADRKSSNMNEPITGKVTNMSVREKDKPVRIRAGADIHTTHVDGKYLGKKWREIDYIRNGTGSKTGWAHLSDGSGWVALDFVELMGLDLAESKK